MLELIWRYIFLSGNMEKIIWNNLLKNLMTFIPVLNSLENDQEKN